MAMAPESSAAIRFAVALGAEALAVWAVTVSLVLLAAVLALRARRRRLASARGPAKTSLARVALRVGAGFVLLVGVAALFAGLSEGRHAGAAIGQLDDAFAVALRSAMAQPVLRASAAITHAGDPVTLTVLGVAVFLALLLSGRLALAFAWVAAVLGNALLNTTLKGLFMRIRPVHDTALAQAEGYSFPSGHTSGAVAAYGMLAYLAVRVLAPAWHLPALCAATLLAVSTAFSRVFLGVHHASDVLAGTLSGGAWLAICIGAVEFHRRRRARMAN